MRKELLYNPRLLLERLAEISVDRRRKARLRHTPAAALQDSQIQSVEFLELAKAKARIKTIYDLGANMGTWSLLADTLIPGAAIHAFEPIPNYQDRYLQTTANMPNATLHKVGVGAETKKARFNVAGHSSSFLEVSENLVKMFPGERKTGELEVDMVRLDDYVQRNAMPLPDLMKLDVEGYELEVLKGAVNCMKHCRYIILEVSFIERHIGQALFSQVACFMGQQDYELCAFPYRMPLGEEVFMADVLFKNKRSGESS